MTFNELDKIIKEIIKDIEFSPDNYRKILEENKIRENKCQNTRKLMSLILRTHQLKLWEP